MSSQNERYSAIARACLAVLNTPSVLSRERDDQIAAVYQAIDHAFNAQYAQLTQDYERVSETLERIAQCLHAGDTEAALTALERSASGSPRTGQKTPRTPPRSRPDR